MARRVSDAAADRPRAAQRSLTRLLVREMRGLRRLIIPSRLQPSVPVWIDAVTALVDRYGAASASLAAEFYDAQRAAARITSRFTVPVADAPPDEQVDASLRWATKDIWTRDPEDPATTPAQRLPLEQRLDAAEERAEQVAQKLVADQGRATIGEAVRQDRFAIGHARAAALGACAFCKMLAARGAVYDRRTVAFASHDGCHCQMIPVFRGQRFELSAHAREWERLYREYAAPHSGEQVNRFRRALAEHGHLPTV